MNEIINKLESKLKQIEKTIKTLEDFMLRIDSVLAVQIERIEDLEEAMEVQK